LAFLAAWRAEDMEFVDNFDFGSRKGAKPAKGKEGLLGVLGGQSALPQPAHSDLSAMEDFTTRAYRNGCLNE
jgi:hypothetical protein